MRTLVISDLHLGTRLGHDVLRRPKPRARLLEALSGVDRLVLLGDTVELLEGHPERALQVAEPLLRAIGAELGGRQVLLVPGNHDAPLVRRWARAHLRDLRPETSVPPDASPALSRLTELLAPADVTVRYPGAWLGEDVWATHGHYLDRHLLPTSSVGVTRGLLGRPPADGTTPAEYERPRVPQVLRVETLLTRTLPRPLAAGIAEAVGLARAATMPRLQKRLLKPQIAPLTATLLGVQMQRASIPALARVAQRLGVEANWVLFGHVHRRGPLPTDDPAQWQGPDGRPLIVNAGSWLYEPRLVHRASPPHPYWPGGAVMLDDGAPPRTMGLLDELEERDLR